MRRQPPGESIANGRFGRRHESVSIGIAIGTLGEIAVETRHDAVGAFGMRILALPLSDARSAGVGHDGGAHTEEDVENAITLRRGTHQFGTRADNQLRFQRMAGLLHGLND